ncbi:branched-chain amino acid transporter permease [Parasutterella sp.]|uniref:branched-chain amino acid transporter permease n=1 Tax=Parasutterella sp. TaxID=2049037 RepID=UPI00351FA9EA
MNDYMYLFTVFIAMGAVTAAERLLPFACSSWLRVGVVGNFLPLAIMVLLVLHASTGSALARGGLPVPEAAGVFLTLIVQWFVKKPLLSIFAGTAVYVILVNSLFV